MSNRQRVRLRPPQTILAIGLSLIAWQPAQAEENLAALLPTPAATSDPLTEHVRRLTESPTKSASLPAEHPLTTLIHYARQQHQQIGQQVKDYQCLLVKRERIHGKLQAYESIETKIRHPHQQDDGTAVPFSVYLRYQKPSEFRGREVLYVDGQNKNRLVATKGGGGPFSGLTLSLLPTSRRAMANSLHPITEIGVQNLAQRLIHEGLSGIRTKVPADAWEVKFLKGSKINGQTCTCVQIRLPELAEMGRLHTLRVFVNDTLQLPVRFAAYRWPRAAGGRPELIQEYTYLNLKVNVGLTDVDFHRDNPRYGFY